MLNRPDEHVPASDAVSVQNVLIPFKSRLPSKIQHGSTEDMLRGAYAVSWRMSRVFSNLA